jgi:hypothetical protein
MHAVYGSREEARGVLVGAFQSEREEETRDRAERGSAVRGSDQASVAPKRIPLADPHEESYDSGHHDVSSRDAPAQTTYQQRA